MIKYEKTLVNISYRNKTHYLKLGYNPIINESLEVLTKHLPSSSHKKIDVICEICGFENNIIYCKYLENKKRHNFYGCRSCSRQKAALTSIEKYGVDNYSKTDEFKDRVEKTNINKYGYKTNLISPEYKKSIKIILKEKYGTENFYEINRNNNNNNNNNNKIRFEMVNIDNLINESIELSESLYNDEFMSDNYLLYRNECRRMTRKNII